MSKKDPETGSRRERFRDYCRAKGWVNSDKRASWAVKAISDATGKPTNKVSDLLNGSGSFGATIARELEVALDLPKGFFDGAGNDAFVEVGRVDVQLAAGSGAVNSIYEQVGSLSFRRDFLRSCGVSNPENAKVVNVTGTSMEPTIPDGAVLLVNTSNTEPRNGHVFALAKANDGLVVKRLIQTGEKWMARSDNPDGNPDFQINDGELVTIIGRAIWMGAKL